MRVNANNSRLIVKPRIKNQSQPDRTDHVRSIRRRIEKNEFDPQDKRLIGQPIFYIISGFLAEPIFLDTQQSTHTFHRSLQPKCTKTYPLLSLTHTTLYQCCTHPNTPASARPDSRCRDSDRYRFLRVSSVSSTSRSSVDI